MLSSAMEKVRKDQSYEDFVSKLIQEYPKLEYPFDGNIGELLESYRELDFAMGGIRSL